MGVQGVQVLNLGGTMYPPVPIVPTPLHSIENKQRKYSWKCAESLVSLLYCNSVEPRPSALNMTPPAFFAERRRLPEMTIYRPNWYRLSPQKTTQRLRGTVGNWQDQRRSADAITCPLKRCRPTHRRSIQQQVLNSACETPEYHMIGHTVQDTFHTYNYFRFSTSASDQTPEIKPHPRSLTFWHFWVCPFIFLSLQCFC